MLQPAHHLLDCEQMVPGQSLRFNALSIESRWTRQELLLKRVRYLDETVRDTRATLLGRFSYCSNPISSRLRPFSNSVNKRLWVSCLAKVFISSPQALYASSTVISEAFTADKLLSDPAFTARKRCLLRRCAEPRPYQQTGGLDIYAL